VPANLTAAGGGRPPGAGTLQESSGSQADAPDQSSQTVDTCAKILPVPRVSAPHA